MEDKIQHHGIIGMRWGVRRTKAQLRRARGPDTPRKVTKEQYEAEKQKAIRSGDKATVERWKSRFDNNELRQALDRVDLEQRLNPPPTEKVQRGRDQVYKIIGDIGKTVSLGKTLIGGYEIIRQVNNTFGKKKMPKLEK